MTIEWGLLATGLSSFLVFAAIGSLVLWRGGSGILPRAFGIWLVLLGTADLFFYGWLGAGLPVGPALELLFVLADGGISLALLAMLVAFPAFFAVPVATVRPWSVLWLCLGVALEAALILTLALTVWNDSSWASWSFGINRVLQGGIAIGLLLWLPSLMRDLPAPQRTRMILLATAVSSGTFFQYGSGLIWSVTGVHDFPNMALVNTLETTSAGLVIVRLASFERGRSPHGWAGAAILLGFGLVGQIGAIAGGGALWGWWNTLWVVTTVGLVAYSLLVGRVLRADLTFRWTIHRGFFPGLAVATFFVVSEGAQQFFGDRAGNAYLGIAGAGLLLFAIGPIQLAAQRLAERAVPGIPTVRPFLSQEDVYRHAVRAAMLDGVLTPAEEAELATLQDRLGLNAERGVAIRHDVAQALGPARS